MKSPLGLLLCLLSVSCCFRAPAASAGVFISEFLAENDGGLHDSDGDSPDWIEIFNDSAAPLDLTGWHLTDTASDLFRWTFPATNIAARGYLVVFASGKDRAIAGAELHTSFQLGNAGQYLALVQPNGNLAHEYSPAYPPQRRNAAYGIVTQLPLLSARGSARYYVPTNNFLALTWTLRNFADTSWTVATNALGYDRLNTATNPATVVLALDFNERGTTPVNQSGFTSFVIDSNINNATIQTNATVRTYGGVTLTFSNTLPHGYDDRVRTTPTNTANFTLSSLLRDHIMSRELTNNGGLDLTFTGLLPQEKYAVTIWSFDTGSTGKRISDWYANGALVKDNYTFDGSVFPTSDSDYQFTFETPASSGGAIVVSGRRDLSSLANSPAVQMNGIRIARTGYRQLIASDVEGAMFGRNASIYTRIPFNVTNSASLQTFELRVRYDDGFVAYINGQVVASRSAPASLSWNSTATTSHLGSEFETFVFTNSPGLLVDGTNVLAIHGLNSGAGDTDFYLEAEIMATGASSYPVAYLWPPTPTQTNSKGYQGFVADTKFSVNRGFYATPFLVSVTSATPGASIYWTTNGSAPSQTNGTLFADPISVSRTLAVRAVAFADNLIPTEIETHSYIFLQQVLAQSGTQPGYPTVWQANYPADYGMDPEIVSHPVYGQSISNDLRSIPALSIVTSHADLWDTANGIYRNSTSIGPAWERAASLELISPDGVTEFAVNGGIEVHGNASRDNARTPKHAFTLSFKSIYGPAKLRYDWFRAGVSSFDTVILCGLGFGDAWPSRYSDTSVVPGTSLLGLRYRPENATYLKDHWVKATIGDMGHLVTRSSYAHVYLNGLYWGLYNPSERVDASFAASHLGGRVMDWDVMAGDESGGYAELRDGFRNDWDQLIAQANAGIGSEDSYQAILEKIDIISLIDYMMVHGVSEMEDWPHHNWYAAHRRATNGVPGTKWIFIPWDQEIGMDRYFRRDRINADSDNTPSRIYTRLRDWPEFRVLYGDRIQKHMFNGGALTLSNNIARFERLAARIHSAMVPESSRWGDARKFTIGANPGTGQTFTRDEWWLPELQQLFTNYFGTLHETYIAGFRAAGLYPPTDAPQFSQFGGAVPAGFNLTIANPNPDGAIYFTLDGTDPRQYGSAAVSAAAISYSTPIPLNAPTMVSARVLSSSGWSALVQTMFYPPQDLTRLCLTEVMYNPLPSGVTDGDEFEFIELKNFGSNSLDLSGLTFTQGITFTFTNGTILPAGQFAVLARNSAAFSARYPGVPIAGLFSGRLDNNGEVLTLAHPAGTRVFSTAWGDSAPWPAAADGFGFSIVPRNPGASQAPDSGTAWRASAATGGSPAADDALVSVPPVVINEILAHTDPPQLDAVELYNPTASNAVVGGWYLTDDRTAPFKYQIPPGLVIPPFGFTYFDASQFNAWPGSPTNFSFSSVGDDVYLFSADQNSRLTGYDHGVEFGASFNGVSFGRILNESGETFYPQMISVTLGKTNSASRVGPVVINEVHYHPESGGFEFLELLNTSNGPVALFHPAFPTNVWKIGGITFSFPLNKIMAPGELLIVAATDPVSFRSKYGVPGGVTVLGPFSGVLQDDGENLTLQAPDNPNTNATPYVAVEELRYNDRSPWPAAADGGGLSLQRRDPKLYGNSPGNWIAAAPTPGRLLETADSDSDGMPDVWEIENGTNPLLADADQDRDGDGLSNGQEYVAGTDPASPDSALKLQVVAAGSATLWLQFNAVSNRSYSLVYRTLLSSTGWLKLADYPAHQTNRVISISQPAAGASRFYRLVTPALP